MEKNTGLNCDASHSIFVFKSFKFLQITWVHANMQYSVFYDC